MLSKVLPFAAVLILPIFFSCNKSAQKVAQIEKDTSFDELSLCREGVIDYDIKTVKSVGVDPSDRSKIIAEVHIKYPELKCANNKLESSVNAYVQSFVESILKENMNAEDTAKAKTIKTAAQAFVRSCKSNILESKKEDSFTDQVWYCDVIGNIEMQSGRYFTMRFKYSAYTGGAHGEYGENYSTFNINSGKKLTWNDVIINQEKFTQLAELRFKQVNGLSASDKLTEDDGFLFENNKFQISDNFGLTNDGLIIYYKPYEVAPFSFGATSLLFKYSEIIDFLNPALFQENI
jgi:hypothetical protein